MATNRKVKIELTAVDKTKRAFNSAAKSVKKFGALVTRNLGKIGLAFGAGGGGVLAGVKLMANEFDALAKTAGKLGTTTEELSKLRYAAELTGVDARKLDTALQRMTRRLSEAAKGTGAAKDALEELGLDAQELAQQTPEEAFKRIADAMVSVENQSDRVRLAFKLFDSEGVALVNTMAEGRAGIEAAGDELERLGGVIDSKAAKAAEQFNDNITRMQAILGGLTIQLANEVIPGLNSVASLMTDVVNGLDFRTALSKQTDEMLGVSEAVNEVGRELLFAKQAVKEYREAFGEGTPEEIQALEATVRELEQKRTRIIEEESKKREQKRIAQAKIDGKAEETARIEGAKEARKTEQTYAEANAADFRKYRAGEITRGEWLERENARNPYSNPNSPYADEFSGGGAGSGEPSSYAPRDWKSGGSTVSKAFAADIQRAVEQAMEGRTYVMKVTPELVGVDDVSVVNESDKAGANP